jgi:hypothetical protein
MWVLYRDGVLLCCLLLAVTIGTLRLSYAIVFGLCVTRSYCPYGTECLVFVRRSTEFSVG